AEERGRALAGEQHTQHDAEQTQDEGLTGRQPVAEAGGVHRASPRSCSRSSGHFGQAGPRRGGSSPSSLRTRGPARSAGRRIPGPSTTGGARQGPRKRPVAVPGCAGRPPAGEERRGERRDWIKVELRRKPPHGLATVTLTLRRVS